jgi:hypothetical protein
MAVSKESLARYLLAAAVEEGMVSSAADLEVIDKKLRSWDKTTFEAILGKRTDSLRELASGEKEGIFSAACYKSQAESVENIIRSLSVILAE